MLKFFNRFKKSNKENNTDEYNRKTFDLYSPPGILNELTELTKDNKIEWNASWDYDGCYKIQYNEKIYYLIYNNRSNYDELIENTILIFSCWHDNDYNPLQYLKKLISRNIYKNKREDLLIHIENNDIDYKIILNLINLTNNDKLMWKYNGNIELYYTKFKDFEYEIFIDNYYHNRNLKIHDLKNDIFNTLLYDNKNTENEIYYSKLNELIDFIKSKDIEKKTLIKDEVLKQLTEEIDE